MYRYLGVLRFASGDLRLYVLCQIFERDRKSRFPRLYSTYFGLDTIFFEMIMPTPETQLSFETLVRGNLENTTSMTTYTKNFAIPRRHMRHVPDLCEKFQIGDPIKREFYSPNYPESYPNSTNCVRVLEGKSALL
ncbi:hypothetical protein ALC57_06976 [Trachymyrmex cornetzi]|uniref:CUB domain-containing protein n=1 Tax=Trachymyrmex cornetzi TaxID=471704 RepID=A0A195E744_9HYME|nr:hypothetical protein ALC57_06976 [Trachymyrmex cornetzi]